MRCSPNSVTPRGIGTEKILSADCPDSTEVRESASARLALESGYRRALSGSFAPIIFSAAVQSAAALSLSSA